MTITRRHLGTGLAAGAIGALIPVAVAYACTALATVNMPPAPVTPGTTMTVTVTPIYADSTVDVSILNGPMLASGSVPAVTGNPATEPSTESLSLPVTIPSLPAGNYYMHADVHFNGRTFNQANTEFTVRSPASTGSGASPAGTVPQQSVTGLGVAPAGAQPGGVSAPSQSQSVATDQAGAAAPLAFASDLATRASARDGVTPALGAAPAQSTQPLNIPVTMNNDAAGSPAISGLAIGAITLAVGLPLVVIGFASVVAYQRRAARATSRKREE